MPFYYLVLFSLALRESFEKAVFDKEQARSKSDRAPTITAVVNKSLDIKDSGVGVEEKTKRRLVKKEATSERVRGDKNPFTKSILNPTFCPRRIKESVRLKPSIISITTA